MQSDLLFLTICGMGELSFLLRGKPLNIIHGKRCYLGRSWSVPGLLSETLVTFGLIFFQLKNVMNDVIIFLIFLWTYPNAKIFVL